MRRMFLFALLFLFVAQFSAACVYCGYHSDYSPSRYDYDSQYSSGFHDDNQDDDYYWARDYYRSSDYQKHHSDYYRRVKHSSYDSNYYARYYDDASYAYVDRFVPRKVPNDYSSRYHYQRNVHENRWYDDYDEPYSKVYEPRKSYTVKYSSTFDRYYVKECYDSAPSGKIFYIKC